MLERGGGWHDARTDCCLKLAVPIGFSPLTLALSLNPSPIGEGAPRPVTTLCPPSPCLADPYLPTHPSFLFVGCANGAPGPALCRVHTEKGNSPQFVQVDTPYRQWGNPPQRRLLGPRCPLLGHFPDWGTQQPSARPFPRSAHQRAHHLSPRHLSPRSPGIWGRGGVGGGGGWDPPPPGVSNPKWPVMLLLLLLP